MNSPVASSVITTRSDWQSCIFCTNKAYKKDGKLHKVEYYGKISRHVRSHVLIHYFPQMTSTCEVWFQTGMVTSIKNSRRYIPVQELCKSLNSVVCNILPAAHLSLESAKNLCLKHWKKYPINSVTCQWYLTQT